MSRPDSVLQGPSSPLPAHTLRVASAPSAPVLTLRVTGHRYDVRDLADWLAPWVDSDPCDGGIVVWDSRPYSPATLPEMLEELRRSSDAARVDLVIAADLVVGERVAS